MRSDRDVAGPSVRTRLPRSFSRLWTANTKERRSRSYGRRQSRLNPPVIGPKGPTSTSVGHLCPCLCLLGKVFLPLLGAPSFLHRFLLQEKPSTIHKTNTLICHLVRLYSTLCLLTLSFYHSTMSHPSSRGNQMTDRVLNAPKGKHPCSGFPGC